MTRLDRAVGVLLGAAAGDALGVPYEYGSRPLPPVGESPRMLGGGLGGYAPGQWSDDTEMGCVIGQIAADGADLRDPAVLDRIADGFLGWYADGPADVGNQTRAVLSGGRPGRGSAQRLRERAVALHARTGRTAGNGSLMRTGPVALAHLGDTAAIVDAARAVSALTHHDPQAGDACVLWCLAIDHAVRTGELDVRVGLGFVGPEWAELLDEAERGTPERFAGRNGWVVAALQAAWAAVRTARSLEDGLVAAVRGGGDTDTVAAIAGALLGARFGGSAVRRSRSTPARRARPRRCQPRPAARDHRRGHRRPGPARRGPNGAPALRARGDPDPVVAAAYGALVTGQSPAAALRRVMAVLPSARPRASMADALRPAPSDRSSPSTSAHAGVARSS
jgi:ADP-ribosyl-[dinitrogen reductase] hydrolase